MVPAFFGMLLGIAIGVSFMRVSCCFFDIIAELHLLVLLTHIANQFLFAMFNCTATIPILIIEKNFRT